MGVVSVSGSEIPSWNKIEIEFSLPPGKEAPAGSGRFPRGQSNQLPASRHHHAGGAAALDVPPHPPGQAARKRQPAAATDLQRGSLLWGTAPVFPP